MREDPASVLRGKEVIRPNPNLAWPIDYETGVVPIGEDEGCKLKAYPCQAGKWTCGWGETDGVGPNTVWTQEYADQRFCDSLTERIEAVKAACTVEPTANQLLALVSFAYNYGGWKTSQALKAHNRGDFEAAARAMGLVNKFTNPATGKKEVSRGLTARRAREAALYLKLAEGKHEMPQEVAPESKPLVGQIATSGAGVAGTGVLTLLTQFKDQLGLVGDAVKGVRDFVGDTLGIPPHWLLPIALIVAGSVVVYYRLKQRKNGWA